jgi:hypothetical protein
MIPKLAMAILVAVVLAFPTPAASSEKHKTKFYNFDEILINGKVKRPQTLWVDTRQKAKFDRLLKLHKDMLPRLMDTRRDRVFK